MRTKEAVEVIRAVELEFVGGWGKVLGSEGACWMLGGCKAELVEVM